MAAKGRADYSPAVNLPAAGGEQDSNVVEMVSSGHTWVPTEIIQDRINRPLDQALAEATPANAVLIRWARDSKNQPDQSWWDETADPFEPERD